MALPDAPLPIGRAGTEGLVLEDDAQVSRLHAKVALDSDGRRARITDVSTNGTYVNGCRVVEATLGDGDVVRVGDSILLVRAIEPGAPRVPESHGLFGDAPVMHDLRRSIGLVGPTEATVVVTGESGTGKELVARAMHAASRPRGPFVAVNCSAIAESLAESELFGHVAGAFTGARAEHTGFFRAAHGGVLFLDEIGELPAKLQPKLLRVLEEHAVVPVGAVKPVPCDVRVVAATNRDLRVEVEEGRFRGDLSARLSEITLALPPLRDRKEDVLPLLRRALGPDAPPLSADLAEALLLFDWPFNVRELSKVAAEIRIRGAGSARLELRLVADRLRRSRSAEPTSEPSAEPDRAAVETVADRTIPDEKELLALLARYNGRIADVARATGRSRKQVYRWLEAHGIDVGAYRKSEGDSGA